ncbi:linoleate 9/13-lipoxygenase-like [Rhopilema esculentum]|uniref:linoleate 9/13-lipoxygenase-like n=1 Tax=Rhopilema esculentum TaxID=499914 RepID=UPI0031E291D7
MEKRTVSILLLVFYLSCFVNGQTKVRLPKVYSRSCPISVCEEANSYCGRVRDGKLKMQRMFYKLTKMISNPNANQLPMPVLDQPFNATMQYFMINKFDAQCFNLFFLVLRKTQATVFSTAMKQFQTQRFTTFQQYDAIGEMFKKGIGIYNPMLSRYFRSPSLSYPFMKDLRKGNFFLSDEYFVQGRLAGMSVMTIRRVTRRGKIGTNFKALKQRLNPNFKWAKAISSVTRRGFWQSISARMVYVSEFPLLSGMQNIPDLLAKYFPPGVKVIPQTNPIAIFASRYNQRKRRYELKPVAIQIDDKQHSKVYTPSDGFNWQVAKALHLITEIFHGHFHEHLLQTHFKMEPICVVLNRQISEFHPLHELLKYHCRGILPLNANAAPSAFGESGPVNILFGFGAPGAIKLVQRGYKKMTWNDIDLENNLKKRGMNDRKKVPFYPYRDDGRVVNRVLKKFARQFVDLYYEFDRDVCEDQELQNFINEVSLKGKKPPNNGIGGVKGLPSRFATKNQLARFLAEVLWIQVQHAAITYPSMVYWDSASLASSKLYHDSRGYHKKDLAYLLPGPIAATVQTNFAMTIGSYHYDNLFDYGDELRDQPMKRLVAKTYSELMERVKPLLDRRNEQRLKRGHVSYPFFVPGWVPNSIST